LAFGLWFVIAFAARGLLAMDSLHVLRMTVLSGLFDFLGNPVQRRPCKQLFSLGGEIAIACSILSDETQRIDHADLSAQDLQ
jgi:hypothetical protein